MKGKLCLILGSVALLITVVSCNEQFEMFRPFNIPYPFYRRQIHLMFGCEHKTLLMSMKDDVTLSTYDLKLRKHYYVQGSKCTMHIKPVPPADGLIVAYEKFETREKVDNVTLDLGLFVDKASGVHTHRLFYAYQKGLQFTWEAGFLKGADNYVTDLGFRIVVTPYKKKKDLGTFMCFAPTYDTYRIDNSFLCNGRNNCGDNSDERDCENQMTDLLLVSVLVGFSSIVVCMGTLLLDVLCKKYYYKIRLSLVTSTMRTPLRYEEFELASSGIYLPGPGQLEVEEEEEQPSRELTAEERLKQRREALVRSRRHYEKLVRRHARLDRPLDPQELIRDRYQQEQRRQRQEQIRDESQEEHRSQPQEVVVYEAQQQHRQQLPPGIRYEPPPRIRWQLPPGVRYEPPPRIRWQLPPGVRYEPPPRIRWQLPPGVRYEPPPRIRWQLPPGVRYEPPQEVRFQPPQGVRFQPPQGILYQPLQEILYQPPQGILYQPPQEFQQRSEENTQQQIQQLAGMISEYSFGSDGSLTIANPSSPQPGPSDTRQSDIPDEFYWSSSS